MNNESITYTLPVRTEKEMAHAERRQREAYEQYDNVQVVPHGFDYVRIVCTQPRLKTDIDFILS